MLFFERGLATHASVAFFAAAAPRTTYGSWTMMSGYRPTKSRACLTFCHLLQAGDRFGQAMLGRALDINFLVVQT